MRYKAMEDLVSTTLSRLDRLQNLTLASPSAMTVLDRVRQADANALAEDGAESAPDQQGLREAFTSIGGQEGLLRDAVMDVIDSTPGIKEILDPGFYGHLRVRPAPRCTAGPWLRAPSPKPRISPPPHRTPSAAVSHRGQHAPLYSSCMSLPIPPRTHASKAAMQ